MAENKFLLVFKALKEKLLGFKILQGKKDNYSYLSWGRRLWHSLIWICQCNNQEQLTDIKKASQIVFWNTYQIVFKINGLKSRYTLKLGARHTGVPYTFCNTFLFDIFFNIKEKKRWNTMLTKHLNFIWG